MGEDHKEDDMPCTVGKTEITGKHSRTHTIITGQGIGFVEHL